MENKSVTKIYYSPEHARSIRKTEGIPNLLKEWHRILKTPVMFLNTDEHGLQIVPLSGRLNFIDME